MTAGSDHRAWLWIGMTLGVVVYATLRRMLKDRKHAAAVLTLGAPVPLLLWVNPGGPPVEPWLGVHPTIGDRLEAYAVWYCIALIFWLEALVSSRVVMRRPWYFYLPASVLSTFIMWLASIFVMLSIPTD